MYFFCKNNDGDWGTVKYQLLCFPNKYRYRGRLHRLYNVWFYFEVDVRRYQRGDCCTPASSCRTGCIQVTKAFMCDLLLLNTSWTLPFYASLCVTQCCVEIHESILLLIQDLDSAFVRWHSILRVTHTTCSVDEVVQRLSRPLQRLLRRQQARQ